MKEHSHISLGWYTLGVIQKAGSKWIIEGLLVRWNERTIEAEYVYDAHRFDYELPPEIGPGAEAVEYYLGQAQSAITQLAQDLAAQEVGFNAI